MSDRNLQDLIPVVREKAERALETCRTKGLDVLVTCTLRTGAEQNQLYAQGRTEPGRIVTNARAGQSMHQYGCALDLYPMIGGKPDFTGTRPEWHQIAEIFKSEGFEWGYDWTHFKEMPHFQFTGGHGLGFFEAGGRLEEET